MLPQQRSTLYLLTVHTVQRGGSCGTGRKEEGLEERKGKKQGLMEWVKEKGMRWWNRKEETKGEEVLSMILRLIPPSFGGSREAVVLLAPIDTRWCRAVVAPSSPSSALLSSSLSASLFSLFHVVCACGLEFPRESLWTSLPIDIERQRMEWASTSSSSSSSSPCFAAAHQEEEEEEEESALYFYRQGELVLGVRHQRYRPPPFSTALSGARSSSFPSPPSPVQDGVPKERPTGVQVALPSSPSASMDDDDNDEEHADEKLVVVPTPSACWTALGALTVFRTFSFCFSPPLSLSSSTTTAAAAAAAVCTLVQDWRSPRAYAEYVYSTWESDWARASSCCSSSSSLSSSSSYSHPRPPSCGTCDARRGGLSPSVSPASMETTARLEALRPTASTAPPPPPPLNATWMSEEMLQQWTLFVPFSFSSSSSTGNPGRGRQGFGATLGKPPAGAVAGVWVGVGEDGQDASPHTREGCKALPPQEEKEEKKKGSLSSVVVIPPRHGGGARKECGRRREKEKLLVVRECGVGALLVVQVLLRYGWRKNEEPSSAGDSSSVVEEALRHEVLRWVVQDICAQRLVRPSDASG